MAKGRDRPRKEPKRKAKEKAPKHPGTTGSGTTGSVAPSYEPPTRQVEVIRPKRKEREPQDPNSQDEG
jgi:hypothetical protein